MDIKAIATTSDTFRVEDGGHWLHGRTFGSFEAAVAAVGQAHRWNNPVWYGPYTVGLGADETADGWSVYATMAECNADLDGAYTPRIVRMVAR